MIGGSNTGSAVVTNMSNEGSSSFLSKNARIKKRGMIFIGREKVKKQNIRFCTVAEAVLGRFWVLLDSIWCWWREPMWKWTMIRTQGPKPKWNRGFSDWEGGSREGLCRERGWKVRLFWGLCFWEAFARIREEFLLWTLKQKWWKKEASEIGFCQFVWGESTNIFIVASFQMVSFASLMDTNKLYYGKLDS